MIEQKYIDRFYTKVDKTDTCWIFTGYKDRDGYGQYGIRDQGIKVSYQAHRFSYEAETGIYPGKLLVCHHCDNPSCVRPDHLFLGTNKDNMEDMVKKGRQGGRLIKTPEHRKNISIAVSKSFLTRTDFKKRGPRSEEDKKKISDGVKAYNANRKK
jgi:hypothetical protein